MFYILENSSQLVSKSYGDCFIRFIPKNNNFHPALTNLSLIYIRPLDDRKGYILCLDHTEAFGLDATRLLNWLIFCTNKLFVLNKKEALHWFEGFDDITAKLYDINFIEQIDLKDTTNNCIEYYYNKFYSLPNINCLIPISKHYEQCELIFNKVLPIISNFKSTPQFEFNNNKVTNVFYQIEKNGIKVNKNCFIEYYKDKIHHPEFNLHKGKIYTQYNLYTTTSRPSNTFNNINFAALKKDDNERDCYKPENDSFIEFDFQGYHPRLIGGLVDFNFPKTKNTYEVLGELLSVSQQEAKELTFKQLYGGVWAEYIDKPFFREVNNFIDNLWNTYQSDNCYETKNKIFANLEKATPNKLFNYIIQSYETSNNVEILETILDYLKDKKTKLVLYTYDAFLFDYNKEDGDIITELTISLQYPVNIKQGKTYHGLTKI